LGSATPSRIAQANLLKVMVALASLWLAAPPAGVAAAADQPAGPTVSKALAKPLKAAQDALQARHWDAVLASLKEAQTTPGEKTAYDNFVINQMLGFVYVQKQDFVGAAPALEAAAQSQYATPEQQKAWLQALMGIYFGQKNYAKTVEFGQQLVKRGVTDSDTYSTIADSQSKLGDWKGAADTIQQAVARQSKPDKKLLEFQWNCYVKVNDSADAGKVIEQLVTYYPEPDYWLNALAPLSRMDIKDAHLQLNVYRLMNDVGVLKRPTDYAEMAELALDQGYPAESQAILEKAFAQKIFTEQRDKDRYQHLLDGVRQRATVDLAQLGASEKDAAAAATGDAYLRVGAAYLSYGQNDKALAAITKGIDKGSLKSPDEARLLLGIAKLRSKSAADAQRDFDKVSMSSNSAYARLGRLWALHAGAGSHSHSV
jgi:hypothetical protein